MEKKKLVEKNGVSSHGLGSPQKIGMLDGFESHGRTRLCMMAWGPWNLYLPYRKSPR